MIKANAHKYSVSAMCKVLNIPRSSYYYEAKQPQAEDNLAAEIREIFRQSRNNYGTRKIKVELARKRYTVSRRRIGRIMKQEGLVSSYNPQFKSLIYHDSQNSISEQKYRQYFNQVLLDTGIKTSHTPHDCRHTCNTLLEQAGTDRTCRYRIMGHTGKDINENIYTHKTIHDLRTAMELIEAPL